MPGCDYSDAYVFPAYAPKESFVYGDYTGDETGDPGRQQAGGGKGNPQ